MEELNLAMVQEPPLKGAKNQDKTATGFSTLPVVAYGTNSRACIVRKRDIKMIPVAHISTSDMAVGLWTTPSDDKIVVCSAYFPFGGEIEESIHDLEKVREYANTKGYGLIIMGDFNAHGETWGSKENNPRGTAMEEYLERSDLTHTRVYR